MRIVSLRCLFYVEYNFIMTNIDAYDNVVILCYRPTLFHTAGTPGLFDV